jgi:hypothetical protein
LDLGEVQVCQTPAPSVTYTEMGATMGLMGPLSEGGNGGSGGSIAVADFDLDNDLDIALGYPGEMLVLYWGEGDTFERGPPIQNTGDTDSLNIADMDGDGWLEILGGTNGYPYILWNEAGTFGQPQALTLDRHLVRIREISPGDVDGDGDVDLFGLSVKTGVLDGVLWDMVIENKGDRQFEINLDALDHENATGQGFDAGWFDWDDDGDLDVYVANDKGPQYGPDYLLENREGELVNARDKCFCGPTHTGMNVDAADFDGDGLLDVIITTADNIVLLKQYADGSFVDVTLASGALVSVHGAFEVTGWGALFFDRDNDGDLDIVVAMGYFADGQNNEDTGQTAPTLLPIALLEQEGGVFQEVSASLGLAQEGTWRSVVTQDFNNDGVLDILVTDLYTAPHLYMSDSCTEASWLRIEAPAGSKITLTAGDRTWVDHVTRESGYGAGQPANVHIGLGDRAVVDRLEIRLLNGTTLVHSTPFLANRLVRISESGRSLN